MSAPFEKFQKMKIQILLILVCWRYIEPLLSSIKGNALADISSHHQSSQHTHYLFFWVSAELNQASQRSYPANSPLLIHLFFSRYLLHFSAFVRTRSVLFLFLVMIFKKFGAKSEKLQITAKCFRCFTFL